MKKLNVILHETTIIDFPFFWKLIVRYKWVSIMVPLLVFSYSIYFYSNQSDIFQRRKYFKNLTEDLNSTTSAIASVLGEKTSGLSESEIVGMANSLDFQQEFTENILKHPELHQLNFGLLQEKNEFVLEDLLSGCGANQACKVNALRGRIFSFISILPDKVVTNKFFIQVSTKDAFTTKVLLEEVSELIVENRVSTIKHKIEEQIKLSKELAEDKREKIDSFNLMELKEQKRELQQKADELSFKITDYSKLNQKLQLDLAMVATQMSETKKATKGKIETDSIIKAEKKADLEIKIKKYEQDIAAIKSVSDSLSKQDQIIVNQLKSRLRSMKKQLKESFQAGRSVSSNTNFILKKDGESRFTEFNHKVLKEQVAKAQADYEKLIAEREEIAKEIAKIDTKIEEVKPAFEYLKLLDQKIVQLDFFNSTVVSDLKFENQLSPVYRYKKTGKSKVALFSLMASFVSLSSIIFGFYLLDDRIFDQTELQKSFEELTIIGNTPDFD